MEGREKFNVEKLGNLQPNSLPSWIKRVLTNTEEDDTIEGEHETEATEREFQIARWNLRVARDLIRQGVWIPTSQNLETLHKLNLKYNLPPFP